MAVAWRGVEMASVRIEARGRSREHSAAERLADGIVHAVGILAAVAGAVLMVNLTLGIVSRIAPQMNIYAVGFPVILTVGLMGIAAGLPLLDAPMMSLMMRAMALFSGP